MRFARWWKGLEKRLTRQANPLLLGHRNLYILPSRFGCLWVFTSGLIYVIGIYTRSNGPLLVAFLMGSLMLLALFLTHFNLQGLVLEAVPQSLGFADESFYFRVRTLSNFDRPGVGGLWLSRDESSLTLVDLKAGENLISFSWPVQGRGLYGPGRLMLFTTAPLGLFRCWTYWEPQEKIWIAPRRSPGPVLELSSKDLTLLDGEEFSELVPWRQGQSFQRLDWKALARGRGRLIKQFKQANPGELWLALSPHPPIEAALEHLCYRVCIEINKGQAVGLELPGGHRIDPSNSPEHLEHCLRVLAELSI